MARVETGLDSTALWREHPRHGVCGGERVLMKEEKDLFCGDTNDFLCIKIYNIIFNLVTVDILTLNFFFI